MAYDTLTPEEIAAKFGGVPVDPAQDADALARKFGGRPVNEPLSAMQAAQAVATGGNRSALAGLPGLPVKAALDVADLARAAYGFTGSKLGLLSANDLPEPLDRAKYVGSPEWIAAQISRTPVGASLIQNPRPDSPAARILNAGGAATVGAIPGSGGQAVMQALSGLLGQTATELGASPATSMLASMTPQGVQATAAASLRGAVRGGEQGRQDMVDRTREFNRAGVDPSVGLATGNRRTQALESLLAKVPGGAGQMAAKIEDMQGQMQSRVGDIRDSVSPVYGPIAAGDALKLGIADYRNRQQGIYGGLLDSALNKVPAGMTFPVANTIQRGESALADIPGAPNVSRVLNQPRAFTQSVVGALSKDAAPQPAKQIPSTILDARGAPFTTEQPATPGGLPLDVLRDTIQPFPTFSEIHAFALKALRAEVASALTPARPDAR